MKAIILFIFLTITSLVGQSTEIDRLIIKKSEYEGAIRTYQDSLADITYDIAELNKDDFERSIDERNQIVYSKIGAPLRSGPSNFDKEIRSLPKDSRLRVTGHTGIYLHVESTYGRGYVSKNLINEHHGHDSVVKKDSQYKTTNSKIHSVSSTNYSSSNTAIRNPVKSYRPKSYRSYIRGPRGGCYYINSNGNKTYVDRSVCN